MRIEISLLRLNGVELRKRGILISKKAYIPQLYRTACKREPGFPLKGNLICILKYD